MDHKRNEAITAKKLAEGMFKNNDIASAKIFASMSQRLCPELEGISQLCAMLDVLDSSEQRINGHANWYGVLSVDPTADDAAIKKQFKRLALMLHPDKNRSVEAKDAFELVSEAKDILLDKQRRSDYDRATGLEREPRRTPTAHRPHRLPGPLRPGLRLWPRRPHRRSIVERCSPDSHRRPPWHIDLIRGNPCPQTGGPSADTGCSSTRTGGQSTPPIGFPQFIFASWAQAPKAPCQPDPARPTTKNQWTTCHWCRVQFELHSSLKIELMSEPISSPVHGSADWTI
ncbi:Dnaj homolog subfamily b member 8 [Phtheirospermum japonicum]|uniref:Dnaj homolog subfamily b member 8 n=1 Tax=Phtheirospermum japonicum TaxID=374723 RepID=A0A830C5B7_9LAMI|nr:Dnaj homolog subfamily b member 8 [Phtheirospermum japonicum]